MKTTRLSMFQVENAKQNTSTPNLSHQTWSSLVQYFKTQFSDHFYEMWKIIERKSSASSTKVARGKINMVLYIHELVSNIFQPI